MNLLAEIVANVATEYLANTRFFKRLVNKPDAPTLPDKEKPMDPNYVYTRPPLRGNASIPINYDSNRQTYGATPVRVGLVQPAYRQELSGLVAPGSLITNGNITSAPADIIDGAGQELYGYPRIAIKKIDLALDTLTADALYGLQGTVLWAVSASTSTAQIKVRFNDAQSDPITWGPGNGLEGIPFERVYLSWAAQAGVTIQLAYFIDTSKRPVRFF